MERREDAAALLGQNRERFSLENLQVVCGSAPEACAGFARAYPRLYRRQRRQYAGDRGAAAGKKAPVSGIVATAVSLESVAELTECLTAFSFTETEVVSLQARGTEGPEAIT